MRFAPLAGMAGIGLAGALVAIAPYASDAGTSYPAGGLAPKIGANSAARRALAHRHRVAAPGLCATPAARSFVGVTGVDNIASDESGVVAGNTNEACGSGTAIVTGQDNGIDVISQFSIIGGGYENRISSLSADKQAAFSFIGAGLFNDVLGQGSFIGSGGVLFAPKSGGPLTFDNQISGDDSFVGAGDLANVSGAGSFVGSGGATLAATGATSSGNQVSGNDSFVGAGDLNLVSGAGSFVGAGGYANVRSGATTAGNQITGNDSLIGAGNLNGISANEAFVGSGNANVVVKGGDDSAIAGGNNNSVSNQYDAIGGGQSNGISAPLGVIGGGSANAISMGSKPQANGAMFSTIGGGFINLIQATAANGAQYAFIGGGASNEVTATYGAIGGGDGNIVTGYMAVVPGGYKNVAAGNFSFAGGYAARASTDGSFVWSDDSGGSAHVTPVRANQFVARAAGGVTFYSNAAQSTGVALAPGSGTWGSSSDRTLKRDVSSLDPGTILAKVVRLPISEWSYVSERGVRHVGPMAQDFYAAFGVGADDRHITSIDEDGVALAAIKGLDAKLERKDAEIASLRTELHALEAAFAASRRH